MSRPKDTDGKAGAYLPTLDGWRAVAIMWVLEGHSQAWHVLWFSNQWLRGTGDRGVQLFFALSGFLICNRLLREEQRFGAISLRSFYTRRIFRIQPAALTYLLVVSLLMIGGEFPKAWSGVAGAALMIRNLFPRTSTDWYTAHFWSLAVEEHFYLLFPGFLVLCRKHRLALMCMSVVGLEIWRYVVLITPRLQGFTSLVHLRTDMVIGGILLGCVFALALKRTKFLSLAASYLHPWTALLFTALVFVQLAFHHSRFDHAVLITVYPLLIAATVLHPKSLTSRILELPPLRFIGRISYSLYLWQQLFFNYFQAPAPGSFRSHVFLCWCATFACATASYYLIEKPLIQTGHKIAKRFDLRTKQEALHPSLITS